MADGPHKTVEETLQELRALQRSPLVKQYASSDVKTELQAVIDGLSPLMTTHGELDERLYTGTWFLQNVASRALNFLKLPEDRVLGQPECRGSVALEALKERLDTWTQDMTHITYEDLLPIYKWQH